MVGIVLLGVFVVLLVFGAPIAVCLGMSSVGAILTQGAGKPLDAIMSVLPRLCSSASSKFVLLAIPFFILSGNVMEKAGISGRLINLAEKCLGHIRGGMAMVCVVNCSPSRGQRKNIKFSRPAAKCCWPLFMQQGTTCVFLSASARPSYAGLFWCCNNGCSTQSFARVPVCW